MHKCPDCARVKSFSGNKKGNGKCRACEGTGEFMPKIEEMSEEEKYLHLSRFIQADCPNCNGSGKCPTCKGTGLVD